MPQIPEPEHKSLPPSAPEAFSVPSGFVPTNGHIADDILDSTDAHPLAHLAGKYNNEPLWDDFLQAMQEVRRQMNEQEDAQEKTTE